MYQLVFRGECTPGTSLGEARQQAQALFKASLDQVDRMFSGQPVVIRNKLEQAQAEKYREVLHKHGMVAYVKPMPGMGPVAGSPRSASSPASAPASAPDKPSVPETQRSGTVARASVPVEPGDRLAIAGDKVDSILAGSDLSLDPVGVTLATHRDVEPPLFQHIDDWTLAPPGSDLAEKRQQPPPVVPDVSHLSLVDDKEAGQ